MPFPHSYVELVGHRAWPSRHAPIPCADRSIHRWGEVHQWLLGEGKRIPRSGEEQKLYGNFAKALRKYLRPRVYIYLCVCACVGMCVDLFVYLTDPRRTARRTRHGGSSTCWPERKTAAITGIAASSSGKAAAISASSLVLRRIAWRAALPEDPGDLE